MKVLLAIDDSICSKNLIAVIQRRCWPSDTEFQLTTVVEPTAYAERREPEWIETGRNMMAQQMQHASKLCDRVKNQLASTITGATIHCDIRKGQPRTEIVASAKEWGADKIVIGTHGRAVCPHNLLGSVSRSVVRLAPCSVEIIKPTEYCS